MNMEQLKSLYRRFRRWQQEPTVFVNSNEEHHCQCCGNTYVGNYCPCCSQKAGVGRISWHSVRQGVLDIWGLGTRSLLYSIWQLLWRPGQIIGEYIDGKRQVSFPPVKMLFILAVIYSMLYYWLLPKALVTPMEITHFSEVEMRDQMTVFSNFSKWASNNYSWFSLIMAMFAVLPTWVMFRYSPHRTAHTLPEGFFIQVFLSVIMLLLGFFLLPLMMVDFLFYSSLSVVLFGLYYIIVYKHLFGYGLWGTFWRSCFVYYTVFTLLISFMIIVFDIDIGTLDKNVDTVGLESTTNKFAYKLGTLSWPVTVFVIGVVINYFVTRKSRRELKQKAS